VAQERLGPSYFFISLVLGPLNSLLWYVTSSRYIWNSAPILFLQEQLKDIIVLTRVRAAPLSPVVGHSDFAGLGCLTVKSSDSPTCSNRSRSNKQQQSTRNWKGGGSVRMRPGRSLRFHSEEEKEEGLLTKQRGDE
jgi:hypothetical protein